MVIFCLMCICFIFIFPFLCTSRFTPFHLTSTSFALKIWFVVAFFHVYLIISLCTCFCFCPFFQSQQSCTSIRPLSLRRLYWWVFFEDIWLLESRTSPSKQPSVGRLKNPSTFAAAESNVWRHLLTLKEDAIIKPGILPLPCVRQKYNITHLVLGSCQRHSQ